MRTLGFLVLMLTLPLYAGPLSAAEKDFGPFDQDRAVIESFSGVVLVEVGDEPGIRATLDGPEEALEEFSVSERDGAVAIVGPRLGERSSSTVVGNTTVIVSGGGRAEVSIGSSSVTVIGEDEERVTLRLTVPEGTPLSLDRITGKATIGDTGAPLTVALLSGTVEAGAVTDADLAINGSGDIRLRQVDGALSITVNGSGSIDVAGGAASELTGRINGSGALRFDGRAKTAEVSINGAGTVALSHVETRPVTHVAGAGSITVGNW